MPSSSRTESSGSLDTLGGYSTGRSIGGESMTTSEQPKDEAERDKEREAQRQEAEKQAKKLQDEQQDEPKPKK